MALSSIPHFAAGDTDASYVHEEEVKNNLKNVYDPEIGVNIVDLGLVYDADVSETGDVLVTMTLTSLGCPLGPVIVQEVQGALKDLPGVADIDVKLVWSPPWSRT